MRKLFIILFFLPVFLGGKPNDIQPDHCDCMTLVDTMPIDSFIAIIAPIISGPVDSLRAEKERELDSLNELNDSLSIEILNVKREKGRKLIVGRIDDIPGERWYWKYWKYRDGQMKYDTVIIIPKKQPK